MECVLFIRDVDVRATPDEFFGSQNQLSFVRCVQRCSAFIIQCGNIGRPSGSGHIFVLQKLHYRRREFRFFAARCDETSRGVFLSGSPPVNFAP